MLIKAGVDISRLERPVRRALNTIEAAYPDFVITSTYEGDHSPVLAPLRQPGDRYPDQNVSRRRNHRRSVERHSQSSRQNFDVIEEGTHIHVEWDPTVR